MPPIGPEQIALAHARVASLRMTVGTLRTGTSMEIELFGLQGATTSGLNGDVAVGGGTRRMGGVLGGARQALGAAGAYARLGAGVGAQTGQGGGRLVGRLALGVALARWPAFVEAGGLVTTCTTAYRSAKTCGYAPVLVGWRF